MGPDCPVGHFWWPLIVGSFAIELKSIAAHNLNATQDESTPTSADSPLFPNSSSIPSNPDHRRPHLPPAGYPGKRQSRAGNEPGSNPLVQNDYHTDDPSQLFQAPPPLIPNWGQHGGKPWSLQ